MTPTANTQTVTGSITGTVVDPGDAVVVGAQVHLTNQTTKQVREFRTAGNGTFTFPDLVPGDYGLRVTQPGFKIYVQNGITVGTLEKVDVHKRQAGSRRCQYVRGGAGPGRESRHRHFRPCH